MYLIANISKNIITISDLNLTLTKNQMLDLDTIPHLKSKRDMIDSSKDLKNAIRYSQVKLMKEDHSKTLSVKENKEDTNEIKNIIKSEIEKALKNNSNNISNNEILNAINGLKNALSNNSSAKIDSNTESKDDSISIEKRAAIHAKTLDKLTKDSKADIQTSTSKLVDLSLDGNIKELEDLIG